MTALQFSFSAFTMVKLSERKMSSRLLYIVSHIQTIISRFLETERLNFCFKGLLKVLLFVFLKDHSPEQLLLLKKKM